MTEVLVIGSIGQVGSALMALLGSRATGWDFGQIDLAQPDTLAERVLSIRPRAVINAAAYTAVDQAEKETQVAQAVNAAAPGALAVVCKELGVPFVHYSTDYVFSGEGSRPRTEEDPTGPLNAYGRTKLDGERAVISEGGKHLVFRTSWVYDAHGKNFLRTMLRLGQERDELRVVNDQVGAPTYAPHLARATLEALESAERAKTFPSGVYHLCSGGETSWHGFAQAIFEGARAAGFPLRVRSVLGIPTQEYPTPAKRPMNSRLSTAKIASALGVRMPHWSAGLLECLGEYLKSNSAAAH